MAKVKITVVKKLNNKDLFGDNPPAECTDEPECPILEVGQEFIIDQLLECPPGFCSWAFADIQREVAHLFLGFNYPWIKEKGVLLESCTDGCRPVIFKLERIED